MKYFLSLSLLLSFSYSIAQQKPLSDSSLYMCVEDFFNVPGKGLAITGKISTGKVSIGQTITIKGLAKDSITAKVNSIEKYAATPSTALAGDNVGLLFNTVDKDKLQRGMVITVAEFGRITDTVELQIKLLPNTTSIQTGSNITVYMHCNDIPNCKVILPASTIIKPGQTKRIKIKTPVPVFVVPNLPIALRNNGRTTGMGKIIAE